MPSGVVTVVSDQITAALPLSQMSVNLVTATPVPDGGIGAGADVWEWAGLRPGWRPTGGSVHAGRRGRGGRAGGCQVAIPEDTFASQIHARLFHRDGQTWVEDLGSTNGTFVNRSRVTAAVAVQRGDQVQIGNTVLELG